MCFLFGLVYNFICFFVFTDTLQVRSVGKRLYSVSGKADEVLNWEKMGIDFCVPAGVISSGGFCDIAVVAVLSGDFIFPDNSIPVSGVFAVGTSCALEKPLTIKLQHCVDISSEKDSDMMVFAKADHHRTFFKNMTMDCLLKGLSMAVLIVRVSL